MGRCAQDLYHRAGDHKIPARPKDPPMGANNNLTKKQRTACLLAIKSQVTGVADFHPNIQLFIGKIGITTILNENISNTFHHKKLRMFFFFKDKTCIRKCQNYIFQKMCQKDIVFPCPHFARTLGPSDPRTREDFVFCGSEPC